MTAKEFLNRAYRIDKRIESKLEEIERLRALASKTTQVFGRAPVSHTRDVTGLENSVIRIMQAQKELDEQLLALIDVQKETRNVISLVADPDCRQLLEMRYIGMKRWEDIGMSLDMGRTQVYNTHMKALAMVDTVLRTMEARYARA